ncbi:hypothetical protein CIW48_26945 [Methylobacterium sp. P1-11]|uniref:hypothetical protein n=1 Tax=Methylobacterium sp. P1-11 TaxID=2024616 RepID=UPI0011F0683C|nr:hypothetical protein [Methylobacterium sp. P1-11]KAA0117844.1 hypothetical protein CIW48_26945 [Methylobacterium sp. P1-11]
MCYLNSASDDTPEPRSRANRISPIRLRRERDDLHNLTGDVVRMLEGHQAGDVGFTGAGTRLTLAATLNALEGFIQRVRDVEAEVLPRPVASDRLPAVASAEAF